MTFHRQNPRFSSFQNNTGRTDGPTDGPTDRRTDRHSELWSCSTAANNRVSNNFFETNSRTIPGHSRTFFMVFQDIFWGFAAFRGPIFVKLLWFSRTFKEFYEYYFFLVQVTVLGNGIWHKSMA